MYLNWKGALKQTFFTADTSHEQYSSPVVSEAPKGDPQPRSQSRHSSAIERFLLNLFSQGFGAD